MTVMTAPRAVIADPIGAVLNEAGRYERIREEPPGSNRGVSIDAWLRECRVGLALPWCMAWAWNVGRQALGHAWPVPRTALVQDLYEWAQPRGLVQTTAKPGDLLVLYYPTLRRYAHVAIVTGLTEAGATTIEGNTSDTSQPATREGWGVFRRVRPLSDRMRFIRWSDALEPVP